MDKEELCTQIMTTTCNLQDFLIDKLSDEDYTKAMDMLNSIWSNAQAIRGDM